MSEVYGLVYSGDRIPLFFRLIGKNSYQQSKRSKVKRRNVKQKKKQNQKSLRRICKRTHRFIDWACASNIHHAVSYDFCYYRPHA